MTYHAPVSRGEQAPAAGDEVEQQRAVPVYLHLAAHVREHEDDPAEAEAGQPRLLLQVLGVHTLQLVLQKAPSEADPKVRNHGEGPY